jgi:hypothetical protein
MYWKLAWLPDPFAGPIAHPPRRHPPPGGRSCDFTVPGERQRVKGFRGAIQRRIMFNPARYSRIEVVVLDQLGGELVGGVGDGQGAGRMCPGGWQM